MFTMSSNNQIGPDSLKTNLKMLSGLQGGSFGASVGGFIGNRLSQDSDYGTLGDFGGTVLGAGAGVGGALLGTNLYSKTKSFNSMSKMSGKDFATRASTISKNLDMFSMGGLALGAGAALMLNRDGEDTLSELSAGMSAGAALGAVAGLGVGKYKVGKMTKAFRH